ncbi:E3 binding domain-containing protein [Halalkalicoccus salilacus]|uniref:E3 binding domain-containing protein n=1 Tax=Halalkalicoccus TaxID=332246 RepID=UPI002F96801F
MGYVIKMPKLGLEMERGTLLEWYAEEGDAVEEGEVIAEIESEKSIGEVEAREDGVLRLVGLEEGETVPPGTPIGIVAGADEEISDLTSEFEDSAESEPDADAGSDRAGEVGSDETEASSTSATGTDSGPAAGTASTADEVKASPRAKRRAEELDVDLAGIEGSGPQGAITADDVEAAAESGAAAEAETEAAAAEAEAKSAAEGVKASPRAKRRAEELGVDLTGVDGSGPQGAITADDVEAAKAEATPAEAVTQAGPDSERAAGVGRHRTATLVVDGDEADALIEATELARNAFDLDVSPLDVLLVATSAALRDHPAFNSTFEDETHQLHRRQDVEIAVDTDEGVVRPLIDEAGTRRFADLVETRHDRTEEAVAGGVSGGRATFALALAEEFDGDVESLVASPTVAGLVANCSRRRAVPAENGVSLRRCLSLSLAYDTRVVGDDDAEAFLTSLLEHVDNVPELVLRTYGR